MGEESAGAAFLRLDGSVWTTDNHGITAALLSADIAALTGHDPGETYAALAREVGSPVYERIAMPATPEQKSALQALSRADVHVADLAGEPIQQVLTAAPGDGQPIGGIEVIAASGWFAARPSGTEDFLKICTESFRGAPHLREVGAAARSIVADAMERRARPHVSISEDQP